MTEAFDRVTVLAVSPTRTPEADTSAPRSEGVNEAEAPTNVSPAATVKPGLAVAHLVTAPSGSAPQPATPAAVPQHAASLLPDGGRVTLALQPNSLGVLVVSVTRSGDSVSISVTGSALALSSISQEGLSDTMASRGVTVSRIDFIPTAIDGASPGRQDSSQPDEQPRDRNDRRDEQSGRQSRERHTPKEDDE